MSTACEDTPSRYRCSYAYAPLLPPRADLGDANFAGATDACGPAAGTNSVTDVRHVAPPGEEAASSKSRSRSDILWISLHYARHEFRNHRPTKATFTGSPTLGAWIRTAELPRRELIKPIWVDGRIRYPQFGV